LFSVGIRLGDGHEASESAGEPCLGSGEFTHHGGIARICSGAATSGLRDVAGGGDSFKRFTLVLHVGLRGFNEIRDEIVATLELDIDLREGIFEAVP
jgi:hypothetical protein